MQQEETEWMLEIQAAVEMKYTVKRMGNKSE